MKTRREVLRTMTFAGMAVRFAAGMRTVEAEDRGKLPLAFSTLGCPAWNWQQILTFAEEHGFAAIELRGLEGDLNLPGRPEFSNSRIAQSRKDVESHGLRIACVSSSTELHHAEEAERAKGIAEAKLFIDLAQRMGAPYVRVFGNKIDGPEQEVVLRVAKAMRELADYAGPRGVQVIIESHGDFVHSTTLKSVLTSAKSDHLGLLWDAHHTFADGKEQPEKTVSELGVWIRHTHLKDSLPTADGKERHYVLTGRGDVPVKQQIAALVNMSYQGYFCFEWEKLWHPDLAAPEVAIADYAKVASSYWREARKA
jgi:sugar phosphate isomerase/epimerase